MHPHIFFGYLDAGSGSIIVQSVIGIVAGVGVFGRKMIGNVTHKAKHMFSADETKKSHKTTD